MAGKIQKQGVMAKLATLRGFAQRFAFASLFVLAFVLMMLGKAENMVVERARGAISDLAAPILDAVSRPVATVTDLITQTTEMMNLRDENARLREENTRLRAWHGVATHLAAENEALRNLLNYMPPAKGGFISARIVGDGGGPFVRSALISSGARDGISKGLGVINEDGLVGRVTDVGQRSARLLLLTDFNSRIPVMIESSRDRAILQGNNSSQPQLTLLPANARPKVGERVVTSGHGGLLPAGLPVGIIATARDGQVRVQPFVNWDKLEYVRIVDFGPIPAPEASAADAPVILPLPERPALRRAPVNEDPPDEDEDGVPPAAEAIPPTPLGSGQ
ncbi:MAG TPA: rod shape-determining protein MreC [Alphaproteobacteria bacterium]|nr:rod shape-determining protein MreC [Alphaproteobacteria bacterium]